MKTALPRMAILGALCSSTLAHAGIAVGDIYQQIGTQGIGIGYAMPITSWAGVHADINGGVMSHTLNAGGMDYDGHLHLLSAGTYLDVFPSPSSGFRLTTGLLFNHDYISGTGVASNGTVTINGTAYQAAGQSVSAKVSYPSVMPYFGVGFGHKPVTTRGFGFTADLGMAYGQPRVDYSVSKGLAEDAGAANIAAEQQKISDSVNHYRWYPIVQVGVSYRFK